MTISSRILTLALVAACAGAGASSGGSGSAASGNDRFAPALGVNLAQMRETPTGLYVRDIDPGTGDPAISGDFVTLEYSLWLADGTPIDSTKGAAPFEFRLGQRQVIAGWEEGVTGMRAGGKRRLVIPPRLGYGMRKHNNIPGNSTLVFDVHLVRISH